MLMRITIQVREGLSPRRQMIQPHIRAHLRATQQGCAKCLRQHHRSVSQTTGRNPGGRQREKERIKYFFLLVKIYKTTRTCTLYSGGISPLNLFVNPKCFNVILVFVPDPHSTYRVQHVESSSVQKLVRMRPGTHSTRPSALKELKIIPS